MVSIKDLRNYLIYKEESTKTLTFYFAKFTTPIMRRVINMFEIIFGIMSIIGMIIYMGLSALVQFMLMMGVMSLPICLILVIIIKICKSLRKC